MTMHAMPSAKPSLGAVAWAMSQDLTDAVSSSFAENLINIVVTWLRSAQFVLYASILHSTVSRERVRNNANVSCPLQQRTYTMRHFYLFSCRFLHFHCDFAICCCQVLIAAVCLT